jgi:hypothetical protein
MTDQDFENSRVWEEKKPFLLDFYVPFSVYDPTFHKWPATDAPAPLDPCCTSCRKPDDRVTVCVYVGDDSYLPAWEFVLSNFESVESALKTKLLAIQKRNLAQHFEENLPGMPDWQKHWDFIVAEFGNPETCINRMYKLTGVSIVRSDPETEWVVGFEFQTAWDMDHGLEIVMQGDKVLAAAGMMELTSTGSSPILGAKGIQEYELDPDDYRLN